MRRPLDTLNLLATAALLALAVFAAAAGRLPHPAALIIRLGIMLLGVFALSTLAQRRTKPLPRPLQWAVDFYPLVLIPAVFDSMATLIPAINPHNRDPWLIAADRWLLGRDLATILSRLAHPLLNDLMYLSYCTYYFFPVVLALVLYAKNRVASRHVVFTVTLAFYISYIGYFAVPARGPRFALASAQQVRLDQTPISQWISTTLNSLENTKDDVFPSGHTMMTVVCLILAWRYDRRLMLGMILPAALLISSTMYCRYHYAVDVIAGILLAIPTVPLARWLDRGAAHAPCASHADIA